MKNVVSPLKSKISTLSNQLADRSLFYKEKESKAFCHLNVSLLQMKPRPKKENWTWLKRKSIRGMCNHFLLQFLYQFVSMCHKSKREREKKKLIFCHPNLQQIRFFSSSSKEVMIYLFSSIFAYHFFKANVTYWLCCHQFWYHPLSSLFVISYLHTFLSCNIFFKEKLERWRRSNKRPNCKKIIK